ncbi:MAG: NfeD family protein [Candidatus Cloacimonadaceae bacterium]|nr:NfeD family protein [Candidatus Cloacimonadaceae bacterium]MDP3114487.1 NfeD family protein [Candidatus Cloacimonadaceae bacterium]
MAINLAAWHIWMIIGIAFVIIEIFDPAFFFISLGIGGIATALICLMPFVANSVPLQIFIFAVVSFIAFLFMRKLGRKVLSHPGGETNVFALKGKTAFVTTDIPIDGKGHAKVGGEEWVAVDADNTHLEPGTKVIIQNIEGNKLIVRKE